MEDKDVLDNKLSEGKNPDDEMFELASTGKRFANYLIDSSIIYMIYHLASLITFQFYELNEQTWPILYVILFSIYLPYYILLEALTGKTIGKMITGTRVVDEDGYKASIGRIVLRNICRLIPFEAFSFLFAGPVGWHDWFSKTRVVIPAKSESF